MSNKRGKNWFRFGWHPNEEELLMCLDGEANERQAARVRTHLEGCWACRHQREKLDRAIANFMEYCETEAQTAASLPPRATAQFAERLRVTAATQPRPGVLTRWITILRGQLAQRRLVLGMMTVVLLASLALLWVRVERPVSAQELLQRTTQSETLSISRVGEPVVYRKLQVKQVGGGVPITWESWSDVRRQQFRQRIADQGKTRFLLANEKENPSVIAELEQIFRANHFDLQCPLSASSFAEWRNSISTRAETVAETKDEVSLTTLAREPYASHTITAATLIVRKRDWHAVALRLQVQGEGEARTYELNEMAYEVLPLQALTVFADLAPTPALLATPSAAAAPVATTAAVPALLPSVALPSALALQEAEIAALYVLHQQQADLGEQLEVVRDGNRQIVVRGLVEKPERKQQLTNALRGLANVSLQLQTVEEALQQARPSAPTPVVIDEAMTSTVTSTKPAATSANPLQQKLVEHFGGRGPLSEAERQAVNRKVTQFYHAIETDASAALAEAWALRRLSERFAANSDLKATSQQRLHEIINNHITRLQQRARSLRTRLEPALLPLTGALPFVAPATAITRPAQVLAIFQAVAQVRQLSDRLIAGTGLSVARELLTELARLEQALSAIEK